MTMKVSIDTGSLEEYFSGNCTAPNACDCRKGYLSTPTGNCNPVCEKCINGDCVAPNDCRCKPGYEKNEQAVCVPRCPKYV